MVMKTSATLLAGLTALLATAFRPAPMPLTQIFLVGDSTMADKADLSKPERGWGLEFGQYIQFIREGKSQYDTIDVETLNVRAYNDGKTAVVNGTILITLPPKDGQPNLAHLKYVVVQVKGKKKD